MPDQEWTPQVGDECEVWSGVISGVSGVPGPASEWYRGDIVTAWSNGEFLVRVVAPLGVSRLTAGRRYLRPCGGFSISELGAWSSLRQAIMLEAQLVSEKAGELRDSVYNATINPTPNHCLTVRDSVRRLLPRLANLQDLAKRLPLPMRAEM